MSIDGGGELIATVNRFLPSMGAAPLIGMGLAGGAAAMESNKEKSDGTLMVGACRSLGMVAGGVIGTAITPGIGTGAGIIIGSELAAEDCKHFWKTVSPSHTEVVGSTVVAVVNGLIGNKDTQAAKDTGTQIAGGPATKRTPVPSPVVPVPDGLVTPVVHRKPDASTTVVMPPARQEPMPGAPVPPVPVADDSHVTVPKNDIVTFMVDKNGKKTDIVEPDVLRVRVDRDGSVVLITRVINVAATDRAGNFERDQQNGTIITTPVKGVILPIKNGQVDLTAPDVNEKLAALRKIAEEDAARRQAQRLSALVEAPIANLGGLSSSASLPIIPRTNQVVPN